MLVKRALFEDAKEILDLQKLAYVSEAEIYNDYSIAPLTQTLDQIQSDFESRLFLKASIDGRIVGSVRGFMERETCHRLGYIPFAFEAATDSLTLVFMEKHRRILRRRRSHPLFSDGN